MRVKNSRTRVRLLEMCLHWVPRGTLGLLEGLKGLNDTCPKVLVPGFSLDCHAFILRDLCFRVSQQPPATASNGHISLNLAPDLENLVFGG